MFTPKESFDLTGEAAAAMLRDIMPESYLINTPMTRMARHVELFLHLQQGDIVLDFHRYPGARLTELTLCAFDDAEPGLLAKVCGTLASLGIDVRTASIYTLRMPSQMPSQAAGAQPAAGDTAASGATASAAAPAPASRWIVLDILLLSDPYFGQERALSNSAIKRVRTTLQQVLQGETTVERLLARSGKQLHSFLTIHELSATNRRMGSQRDEYTAVTLRADDSPGLLYRMAAALASVGLNIRTAQINSVDHVSDDLFFVTTAQGHTVPAERLAELSQSLRASLRGVGIN